MCCDSKKFSVTKSVIGIFSVCAISLACRSGIAIWMARHHLGIRAARCDTIGASGLHGCAR